MKIEIAEIRELFAPYNIPVWYSGIVLDNGSETNSNEYEWGPDVSSSISREERNEEQETITKEDFFTTKQKIELERRQEELRIQRKEAYTRQQKKGDDKDKEITPQEAKTHIDQAFGNIRFLSNKEQDVPRYGRTIEELRDSQVEWTINLEEVEFERRKKIAKEFSISCASVCQLENANEFIENNQEGTCNTKDVCVDIIHLF